MNVGELQRTFLTKTQRVSQPGDDLGRLEVQHCGWALISQKSIKLAESLPGRILGMCRTAVVISNDAIKTKKIMHFACNTLVSHH